MEFGDAPTAEQSGFLTSYPTTAADTGARHLMGGPRFSQTAVYERDGTPSADALYEESVDQTNPLQIGPLVAGSTALIGFSVFGANGFMNAWIDTNRDGDWDDVGEQIVEGRPVTANEVDSVQFLVPAELSGQRTYLRARVSSDPDLGTNGLAPDGEVVDIAVDVQVNSGSVAPPTAVIGSTANGLTVDENERVDRFSIHLSARPQGGSTVRIDSDALSQILVSPSMLTFDSGNWRQPQFVTVAGVSDSVEEQELTTYLNITALDSDQVVTSSAQIGVRVIDMTPAPSLLARVELAAGETIQAGVEWIAEKPFAENGVFKRQIVRANDRVIISGDNLWQNPLNRFDVDLNGGTTALDALLVINEVARRDDIAGTDLQDPTPVQLDDFRFYDVSADGRISALDALQVINHLSRESIRSNVSVVNLYALPDQDSEDEKYRLTDEAVATLF